MPVFKFRTVEEMSQEHWREPGDPALYRAIRLVWEIGRRTSRRRFRTGVYKYRDVEQQSASTEHEATTLDRERQ
jgi:hypothetical protein